MTEAMHGLGNSRIPPTIMDAIYVAQNLGVNYLWVDSSYVRDFDVVVQIMLIEQHRCIIQDDVVVDKNSEIAKMHLIHQNARLTTVSALTRNFSEHFLVAADRRSKVRGTPPGYRLDGFQVPLRDGVLMLASWPRYDSLKDPVNERAWALEEHLSLSSIQTCYMDHLHDVPAFEHEQVNFIEFVKTGHNVRGIIVRPHQTKLWQRIGYFEELRNDWFGGCEQGSFTIV